MKNAIKIKSIKTIQAEVNKEKHDTAYLINAVKVIEHKIKEALFQEKPFIYMEFDKASFKNIEPVLSKEYKIKFLHTNTTSPNNIVQIFLN